MYPRSVIRDVAAELAAARQMAVDESSWTMLTYLIFSLCDSFEEHQPGFDREDFLVRCRAHQR